MAMAISANVRHYYLETYSSYGHISLVPDLAAECLCTYLLMGSAAMDKSTFIKLMGIQLSDRRYDVDYIRQAGDPDSLAGLFLPESGIFLIDLSGFSGEVKAGSLLGQMTVNIDLEECVHKSRWESRKQSIGNILEKIGELEKMRDQLLLVEYPQIHEPQAEQIMGSKLPRFFQSVQGIEKTSSEELNTILAIIKRNKVNFCFLHALQSEGWVNHAPRYLRNFDRICVDQEGSEAIWQDILSEIKSLGQRIEIILHPVYPFRIVGIVFPWKNLALWRGSPVKPEELGLKKHHSAEFAKVLKQIRHLRQTVKGMAHECVSNQRLDEIRNDLISQILGRIQKGK
jgi:hypothetical protein